MRDDGLLIGTELGPLAQATWPDKGVAAPVDVAFYDATNPRAAHTDGIPPMRPLFIDFPADPAAWEAEYGARERPVYLPRGSRWTDAWTGGSHDGGNVVRASAPLGRIPLFLRDGADLPIG